VVDSHRIAALCQAWRIPDDARIVLAPGRVAPWNGQLLLPDAARALLDGGIRNTYFVIVGENRRYAKYARAVFKQAQAQGVGPLFRLTGHCRDMPAAFAAADVVVVPAMEAPLLGRVVAEAQAMARPVVTSDVGNLAEHVVAPPEMPEEVRTGWVVRRGDPIEFARALSAALTLDGNAYRAMSARARQFAEYMFSHRSVAIATRAVYASLLAREP
jgi:glycosyltransferase involved in cell wall biosynthesis